ncbi:MAG: PTS glucose transporter subunit IIA [Ruminococcus sp.]|nr:PTS glucose transporter subunit IIA [Ruminococcus sp.]
MKLFQNLFGRDGGIMIAAPLSGRLVSIKEVSDPTFSEEVLGRGAAIIPADGKVCAPADGVVNTVFPTGHAAAMTSNEGVEILIHVGLDTVKLNGKHFTIHAAEGQEVKKGDLLIEADIEQIKAEGYDIITPVIICNSGDFSDFQMAESGDVAIGDDILTIRK